MIYRFMYIYSILYEQFFYFKSLDLKSESYLTEIITSIALY